MIGRGLENRHIFNCDSDRQDFLNRLGINLSRCQSQCLAWAVMSNHYHLLIRVGTQPLSKLMAPILGGFAWSYNKRHDRSGYVFQNRFQSILCDDDSYLLELVRYIHLNPIRAGVLESISELDRYPWTGHSGLVTGKANDWHAVNEVLALFGRSLNKARHAYWQFVSSALRNGSDESDLTGGWIRSRKCWESVIHAKREHILRIGDERILGHPDFVNQVLAEDELRSNLISAREQEGWNLEILIEAVCTACGVELRNLRRKARNNQLSRAKSLICYWGVDQLGLSLNGIADRLQISQQAASKWYDKGLLLVEAEKLCLDGFAR